MRGSSMPGRFTINDELDNIHDGMQQDLQMPAGQWVDWWQWDSERSSRDPIYDTAATSPPEGRIWLRPISIPCLTAHIYQGQTHPDERGFYNIDRLHLTIDMRTVWRFLPTLPEGADEHLKDRIVFRGQVYSPYQVWALGQVADSYTVLTVDLVQVKADELVNDPQFQVSLSAPDEDGGQSLQPNPGAFDPYFATYDMPGP